MYLYIYIYIYICVVVDIGTPQRCTLKGCVLQVVCSLFSRYFLVILFVLSLSSRYLLVIFSLFLLRARYLFVILRVFSLFILSPRYLFVMWCGLVMSSLCPLSVSLLFVRRFLLYLTQKSQHSSCTTVSPHYGRSSGRV